MLARAGDARLLVRTVIEDQVPPLSIEEWITETNWREFWEPARRTALAGAIQAVEALGARADVSAMVSDPGYELRALSHEVDLVAVGSRRWGPIARVVSGGVGETRR